MLQTNHWVLSAEITSASVLRYTPAGVPVLEFELTHSSLQHEALLERTVQCVVKAVALGTVALQVQLLPLGASAHFAGFLALRTARSKALQFHVTELLVVNE